MYSIIIADDEDITRMALSGYIRKNHPEYAVDGAFSNGTDVLNCIRDNAVNVVITDIRMPGMDGLELARHICEDYPGIIILIISGYSEFSYAKKAIAYGVSDYLLKPLDFEELSRALSGAKEKLDSLYADTDCREEELQLFFVDLISGTLKNREEAEQRFARLTLTGSFNEYKGCLLTVTPDREEAASQWKYGREKLAVALLNGLRMALTEYEVHHLFRSGPCFYFILLSRDREPDFSPEIPENVLYHILHFTCRLQIQSRFAGLDGLRALPSVKEESMPGPETSVSDDDIIIKKATAYIRSHYAEDLTREDVADAVFLSSAYFSRFFKQKTGLNFIDYLTTVRMQKAAELLGTRMKVGEIAGKVGYQSRNRFFINFRQYSGYNPTEYRRQILKMEDTHEDREEGNG